MKFLIILLFFLCLAVTACDTQQDSASDHLKQQPKVIRPPAVQESDSLKNVAGVARMMQDGTVKVMLRTNNQAGQPTQVIIVYKTDDPEYKELLKHIGGLEVGETKTVPMPWPKKEKSTDNLNILYKNGRDRNITPTTATEL